MTKTKTSKTEQKTYSKDQLIAAINSVLAKEKTVAEASRASGIYLITFNI